MATVLEPPCDQLKPLEDCLSLNRHLKLLMDSSSNIFLLLDPSTLLVWCSNSALSLMGVEKSDEVLGKPLHSLFDRSHNEDFLWHNSERLIRLMSGQDWFVEDDVINWPTVGERFYRITCRRLPNKDGHLERILMILNDVTYVRI
jgi:PAS domain-containing protein